jgi:hypothetical protein
LRWLGWEEGRDVPRDGIQEGDEVGRELFGLPELEGVAELVVVPVQDPGDLPLEAGLMDPVMELLAGEAGAAAFSPGTFPGQFLLHIGTILESPDEDGMAGGNLAGFEQIEDGSRKVHEGPQLAEAAGGHADGGRYILPGASAVPLLKELAEVSEGADAIAGREIFTQGVLGELDFEGFGVGELPDDAGDGGQSGDVGGAVAALAGDDLVLGRFGDSGTGRRGDGGTRGQWDGPIG